jgi:OMF family outer membrane factor
MQTNNSLRSSSFRLRNAGYGIALTIALFSVGQLEADAQTAAPADHYSLERTIKEALAASTEIQVAARTVEIDRKQADVELAQLNPAVGINSSATRYDAKTQVAFAGVPPITVIKDHSEAISLGVSLDLDIFGKVRRAASQSTLQSLADQMNLASVRNERILYAKSVFYSLLRSEHQVQVAEAALATAKQQHATALKLNLGQVGQKIDVLRANSQVANSEQDLTTALNNRDIAHNNFNDLVGRALDLPLEVEDVPGVTAGVAIGANSPVGDVTPGSNPPYAVPGSEIESLDVAASVKAALERRPEVLAAQIQVRSAETGIRLARGGLDPTLSLAASGNYYPTTSFQSPRQSTAQIGINFNIPLYDGGATRARVDSARLQTANSKSILDRRKKDVALEVRQAYLNLVSAARQIDAANTGLAQAIAARRLAQARYEGQVGIYLEITDAQSALVQAENSQVNAVYVYLIARAQFENAIGAPATK